MIRKTKSTYQVLHDKTKQVLGEFKTIQEARSAIASLNKPDVREKVYKQLEEDFPKAALAFVKKYKWIMDRKVPLSSIDYSNSDTWRVNKDAKRKKEFIDKVGKGMRKPAILLKEPSKKAYRVLDGHSRLMAARILKLSTYPCYIVEINEKADIGKALEMHASGK